MVTKPLYLYESDLLLVGSGDNVIGQIRLNPQVSALDVEGATKDVYKRQAQKCPKYTIGSHRIYGGRGRYGIFLMGGNRRLAPIGYDRGRCV